jgi:hypothetical protein
MCPVFITKTILFESINAMQLRVPIFLELLVCGIQNSEVNDVSNVIIIQNANTKSSVGQHGPPKNAKVGSGIAEA